MFNFSAESIDTSQYVPVSLDLAEPDQYSIASILTLVITGSQTQTTKMHQILQNLRTGPNKHLCRPTDSYEPNTADKPVNYLEFEGITDLRLFAREIRINIFVYFSEEGGEQPYWVNCWGNKGGNKRGAIFLQFMRLEGVSKCLLVTGVRQIERVSEENVVEVIKLE